MASQVEREIKRLMKRVDDVAKKQIPFATALALTRTAKLGQEAGQRKLNDVVHMPTARTKGAFFTRPATKKNLNAGVFLKDRYKGVAPSSYLTMLTGGKRNVKASERLMQGKGLLGMNQSIMPTGQRANNNGNVTAKAMRKMLNSITSIKGDLFVVNSSMKHLTPSSLPNGIYKRMARSSKQLFTIVDYIPRIRKRFDFDKYQARNAKRRFPGQMKKAWAYALKTAR